MLPVTILRPNDLLMDAPEDSDAHVIPLNSPILSSRADESGAFDSITVRAGTHAGSRAARLVITRGACGAVSAVVPLRSNATPTEKQCDRLAMRAAFTTITTNVHRSHLWGCELPPNRNRNQHCTVQYRIGTETYSNRHTQGIPLTLDSRKLPFACQRELSARYISDTRRRSLVCRPEDLAHVEMHGEHALALV